MQAFLMSGMGASFVAAGPCPVVGGPHCAPVEDGSFLVADASTRDGSASVRVALWRCQFCGTQLTGLGCTGPVVGGDRGTGVDVQEFTWLEEAAALVQGPR